MVWGTPGPFNESKSACPSADLLNQKLWGCGPAAVASPPGDSGAWEVRTTRLERSSENQNNASERNLQEAGKQHEEWVEGKGTPEKCAHEGLGEGSGKWEWGEG